MQYSESEYIQSRTFDSTDTDTGGASPPNFAHAQTLWGGAVRAQSGVTTHHPYEL